jgi:hypothetical protein
MKLTCTLRLIEDAFTATAFAEENEHETARELLRQQETERAAFQAACDRDDCHLAALTPAVWQNSNIYHTEKKMNLTSLLNLLQETFTAAAFAESNEHETALTMLGIKEAKKSTFCACSASGKDCLCTLSSAAWHLSVQFKP